MIIFTPILFTGEQVHAALCNKGITKTYCYNLTALDERVPSLSRLLPSLDLMPRESLEGDVSENINFDIAYGQMIFGNDASFFELMSNIIVPVYSDPEILIQILVQRSEFRDCITESLAKLIQQRYGYNCYIINTFEDLYYLPEESGFSVPGLMFMEHDLVRYCGLAAELGINVGGDAND